MKKLLLMVVCFAGLAYYNAGASESTLVSFSAMAGNSTCDVTADPYMGLNLGSDGWYLTVHENDRPIYVVIDGPETAAYAWYVPAGGGIIKVSDNVNIYLEIAEWYYA